MTLECFDGNGEGNFCKVLLPNLNVRTPVGPAARAMAHLDHQTDSPPSKGPPTLSLVYQVGQHRPKFPHTWWLQFDVAFFDK